MAKKHSRKLGAKTRHGRADASPNWPLLALLGLGMAITGYLTGVAWLDSGPALCGEGSGCDLVQNSRWSRVLGLPLALWGFALYALMLLVVVSTPAPTKRWRRVWRLSVAGLAISLYLTLVGLVELQTVCLWCLASLATLIGIVGLLAWQRPAATKPPVWWYWPLNSAILALVMAGALHIYYYSDLLQPPPSDKLEALAEHLDERGAVFYGASWCSACQQQKRLFHRSSEQLPYVECSPLGRDGPRARVCVREDISNYPTWIIEDRRYEGVLEPKELARHSGFEW